MSKKVFQWKKKWIFLASTMLIFSSLIGFRHFIFRFGVETYLNMKMGDYGGWNFQYDKSSLQWGQIDLKGVDVGSKGVGAQIQVDKVSAILEKQKGFRFELRLVVEEPVIEIERVDKKSELTLSSMMQGPLERYKIDITDGLIKFVDAEGKVDLYFSLEGDSQRRSIGTFYLSEAPSCENDISAMVKLYQWPKELIIESELKNARVVWLSRIVKFFQGGSLEEWENLEGVVSGQSWMGFNRKGDLIQTTANIDVEAFSCERKGGDLSLSMDELSLDFSFPSGRRKSEQRETWWQSLALKSQIQGGLARFKDSEWGADFTISDIGGTLNFSTFKDSEIELKGFLHQGGEVSPIVVNGNPSVLDRDSLDLDMRLFLEPNSKTSTHLNLLISSTGRDSCLVRGQLKELDAPQIKMFQHLIGFALPEVKDVHFNKGDLSCELSLIISEAKVSKLLLENLIANNMELYWASQDVFTSATQIEGSAQLDIGEVEKFRFPSWKVKIQDGKVVKATSSNQPLTFSDIDLEVIMCRDVFEPSWAKAKYDDVNIDLNIAGYFSEANVKISVKTPLERALRFYCPEDEALKEKFGGYGLGANFDLHRQLGYWEVTGDLNLDVLGDWIDKVDVGFHLSDEIMKYEGKEPIDVLQSSISKGNLEAKNISCEFTKIFNHFTKKDWNFEGMVSLDGSFNSTSIDLEIESSYLNLASSVVDVRLNSVLDSSSFVTSEGRLHYDWSKESCQFYFPLHQSVILLKEKDLIFSDARGEAFYDGKCFRFEDVECEVEGLLIKGMLETNTTPNNGIFLTVNTDEISGSSESLQAVLNKIDSLKELKFPFSGKVNSLENGFLLSMEYPKEGPAQFDWEAQISLMQASMPLPKEFAIEDMRFDFQGSSKEQKMYISSLFGKVHSFDVERDFFASAREIEIDYSSQDGWEYEFDVRLENPMMDLVRVVGSYNEKDSSVFLDKELSHFFESRFQEWNLAFTKEKKLKDLDCRFSLSFNEVSLFARTLENLGYEYMSISLMNSHSNFLEGNIEGGISLKDNLFAVHLESPDLSYAANNHFPAALDFEVENGDFRLINSKFGEIELEASLKKTEESYSIEDMIISLSDEKLEFEKGEWSPDKKKWSFPIQQTSVDLSQLFENAPNLSFGGMFEVNYENSSSPFTALFKGNVGITNLADTKIDFSSTSAVHIEYMKERGFLIKDSSFSLKDGDFNLPFDVPTMVFLLDEKVFQGYRIKTQLSDTLLAYLSSRLTFGKEFREIGLPNASESNLDVYFDFEYAKDQIQIGGTLPTGEYFIKGREYELEELNFLVTERKAEITGNVTYLDQKFNVCAKTHPYNQFDTTIDVVSLSEDYTGLDEPKPALHLECRLKVEDGLTIDKIDGDLFGFDFHFVPKTDLNAPSEKNCFLGSVKLDLEEMKPLLGKDSLEMVDKLKLHKGYELSGELKFNEPNFTKPVFEGAFKGKDCDLLGLQLKTFFSSIYIDENITKIKDLKIADDAFTIMLKDIKMNSKKGDLAIEVPEILVKDLRPSLLQKRGKVRGKIKPFHIKNMQITDLTGMLNKPETLTAKGHLDFVNTFKKGSNLLDVPIEIISRLGLDTGLLVPIQGEMECNLQDGKFIFTKLKNSFSDNKRSYFYLWNKSESFVDLDGNVHIDIRMKQYVLFKITEMFVLSINGSLDQPKFSLK